MIDNVGIGTPMGVAVDWLHNRLYWTDPEKDMIESSDLDGGQRVIVVWRGLDRPQDIVVHPERGCVHKMCCFYVYIHVCQVSWVQSLILTLLPTTVSVHVGSSAGRALCLECRVSWVRIPPEAAHFFFGKVTALGVLCCFAFLFV